MEIHNNMKSETAAIVYVPDGEPIESGFYEPTRNLSKIKALVSWGLVTYCSPCTTIFYEDDVVALEREPTTVGFSLSDDPPDPQLPFGGASDNTDDTGSMLQAFTDASINPFSPRRSHPGQVWPIDSFADQVLPTDQLSSVLAEMETPLPMILMISLIGIFGPIGKLSRWYLSLSCR